MKNYSNIIFKSGPVQTIDYINDRYDITHEKLYKNALNMLILDIAKTDYHNRLFILNDKLNLSHTESRMTIKPGIWSDSVLAPKNAADRIPTNDYIKRYVESFKKTHKFIEIKADEYFKPSSVLCIGIDFPFERKKYDLSKYWNTITESRNNKDISLLQLDEDTIKYAELIYIDYVKGKCKFKSKLTGEEFWTTFDYINDETKVSDTYSLDGTFTYKFQNKIFGK